MNTREQKLKDLEERQRKAADEQSAIANRIKELREELATPEPVVPWEPNDKGHFLRGDGTIHKQQALNYGACMSGRVFATEEEAEKGSEFFTFYQRLYQLAMECNAKHTAYGYFHVQYGNVHQRWLIYRSQPSLKLEVTDCFTSIDSAVEACGIMNRDGWKLPSLQ